MAPSSQELGPPTIPGRFKDLDAFLETYNTKRPHQGRNMKGRTPITVFIDGLPKPKNDKEDTAKKAA